MIDLFEDTVMDCNACEQCIAKASKEVEATRKTLNTAMRLLSVIESSFYLAFGPLQSCGEDTNKGCASLSRMNI
jgi:hypothetical protein